MALPPTDKTDEAFLREVDEELRRDQAMQIWRRWGKWIIGAVVLGLLAFAAVLLFQHLTARSAQADGEKYHKALESLGKGQPAQAAIPLKELSESGGEGYRAMARLVEAQQLLEKNDLKGAAAKYGAVAADTALPQPFRDLALLRQTSAEFDTLKPEMVIERLRGLTDPGSAFFGSAGELVAAAHLKLGKRDAAGKLFNQIAQTTTVPESIRDRASKMANQLGAATTAQTGETKAR